MRVSTLTSYYLTTKTLGDALSRVQQEQGKVASGKQLTSWADDAPAASAVERYRSQEADWTSYQRSANDAKSWLGAADGTMAALEKTYNAKFSALDALLGTLKAQQSTLASALSSLPTSSSG